MQVLQGQSDFSDVEPGMALGEGPHLVQMSEHLTTTYIVCVRSTTNYVQHRTSQSHNHQMQAIMLNVISILYLVKLQNNEKTYFVNLLSNADKLLDAMLNTHEI